MYLILVSTNIYSADSYRFRYLRFSWKWLWLWRRLVFWISEKTNASITSW